MTSTYPKPISRGRWTLLYLLHIFGLSLAKMSEWGPLLFPYTYVNSDFLRNMTIFLGIFLVAEYVFIHLLLRRPEDLRHFHKKLLILDLSISLGSVPLLLWLARSEAHAAIGLRKYIIIIEGLSVTLLLLSGIVTLYRGREHSEKAATGTEEKT